MVEVSEDTHNVSDDDYVEVTVLSTGQVLEYVVPSFPVYKATIQEIKVAVRES